jgi:hypothetical protein
VPGPPNPSSERALPKRPSQKTASQNRAQFNEKLATHERPKAGTTDRLAQAGGAAAIGAGGALAGGALADRGGREGQIGEGREGQIGEGREGLQGERGDRQEGRQGERGERQEGRTTQRDDRQVERGDRQEGRQGERGERQDTRVEQRGDRQEGYQQNREARRDNVDERRQDFTERRDDIRQERQDRMDDIRENRQDFADDWLDRREDLWDDIYDDRHYWGDWDDHWFDDDNWWVWGLAAGAVGFAIGAAVDDPPYGTVAVPYGGTSYQYYGGAFYEPAPSGQGYVTTTAPIGATVAAPPIDCTIVFSPNPDDPGYCYFQGAFFVYDEKQDQYVVADPALGTEVPYLPEGYQEVEIGGKEYLELGGIYYRHYIAGDEEVFVVAKA